MGIRLYVFIVILVVFCFSNKFDMIYMMLIVRILVFTCVGGGMGDIFGGKLFLMKEMIKFKD